MKAGPVYIWWFEAALFAPSVYIWAVFLSLTISHDMFDCPFDYHGIVFVYLPLLAAVVGFVTPLVCLRLLRRASRSRIRWLFGIYLATMLTWGIIDVRNNHYQMGGHGDPDNPIADGHAQYWHLYFTWYFIPYRLIER